MRSSQKQDDVCVVCCRNSSMIYAVGPCDHPVCFICSSRMRVLCVTNECGICRQDMPKVIFTKTEHPYSMLSKLSYRMDNKYKICFSDDEIAEEYYRLLEDRCSVCPNTPGFHSFGHLKDHLRKQHEMFFCDLCVDNLKLFTFERRCYNRKDLAIHKRVGDPDDTSHKGHPLCRYCDQRYVDKDELYRHLRKDHYYCHFCDADGINNSFYPDYTLLYAHFHEEHFVCEEGSCQDDRYTGVFRSDIDLIAHKAAHHSKNLTKQQAKQARTLELNFSIAPRPTYQNGYAVMGDFERDGHNRRGGRKGPKGREPQHEKNARNETPVVFPERYSPEPEMVDMQSEKDFPHLSSSAMLLTSIPASDNQTEKGQKNRKPTKWNGAVTSFNDHFPSLSTTVTPSSTSSTFTVQLNNKENPASRQHGPNISIQVSSKTNQTGKAPAKTPQTSFTIVQTSRPSQTVNKVQGRNTFEQHFPQLGNAESVRTTVTVPVWNKSKEPKREEFVQVKGKNKKKVEKNTPIEVQPKQKTSSDSGNKKKKKEPSEDSSKSDDKKLEVNSEPPEPEAAKPEKKSDDCIDGTKELQQKTHNLIMDDFPTLESVHPNKAALPPGFQVTKQTKKAQQPPPGFLAAKPSISISLNSVAEELTKPNINNNTDSSDFSNGGAPSYAKTYLEPNNFQLRNLNLIQEIRNVLQNPLVFDQFRTLSGQFRQSLVSPTEYYERCIDLFGKENFGRILPELLVLLPDISKQQELLSIYNKCKKSEAKDGGAVPKNGSSASRQFMVCASCQQVLCNKDFRDHMASHCDDFPSLVPTNRTTTQVSWGKK